MPFASQTSQGQNIEASWAHLVGVYNMRLVNTIAAYRHYTHTTLPQPAPPVHSGPSLQPAALGGVPVLPYGTALTGAAAVEWADAILQALGAPTTRADVNSMTDWFGREGGGGQNNPMNTTLVTSGSIGSINSAGVQSYSTPAAGVSATVQTLLGGYPAIVRALRAGTGLLDQGGEVASELSTWSGGGYDSV